MRGDDGEAGAGRVGAADGEGEDGGVVARREVFAAGVQVGCPERAGWEVGVAGAGEAGAVVGDDVEGGGVCGHEGEEGGGVGGRVDRGGGGMCGSGLRCLICR